MSLSVENQLTETPASLMASPEIQFVSLVQHAANREPFRVVKNDQTGGDFMAGGVVQRIIAPEGTDVMAVLAAEGIDLGSEVSVSTKSEHAGYDVYTQIDIAKFDTSIPFQMKRISEKSDSTIMVVTGTLKAEDSQNTENVEETAVKNDLESPLNTTLVAVDVENGYYGMYITTTSAMDSLDNELWNLNRAIYAIGNAAGLDGKSRLKAMIAMIDGFKNYVTTLMSFVNDTPDTSTDTTQKSDPSTDVNHTSKMEKLSAMLEMTSIDALKSEELGMKPDQIAEMITNSVAAAMSTVTKAEKDAAVAELTVKMDAIVSENEALKTEKADAAAKIADAEKTIATLTAEKADLEKKVADLEDTPPATSAIKADSFRDTGYVRTSETKSDSSGLGVFDSVFFKKS